MQASIFRLSYNASIPFSWKYTILLYAFYVLGFLVLLVWNFLTSAKGLQCSAYYSGNYDADICEPTPLEFSREYFTRPIDSNAANRTIGTFPWTPLAFGKDNGPLDYSILSLNWTANPLQCVLYEQYLTLHLLSEGSTLNTCYYCGPDLRILCTTVDSERSQIPDSSADAYVSILDSFNTLSVQAHQIATTAQEGATVGSVRINVHRPVAGLEPGVLKYSDSLFMVTLGTTLGSFPIYANSSNSGVAQVARTAESLSTLVEQATSLDLQPANGSGQPRTLQASYICRDCRKRYKPTLEIIALLITGIFGVLTPAFAFAKLVAEWSSPPPETTYDPATNAYVGKIPPASPGLSPQNSAMQQLPQQPYMGQQPYAPQQPFQPQPQMYNGGQPQGAVQPYPAYGQA